MRLYSIFSRNAFYLRPSASQQYQCLTKIWFHAIWQITWPMKILEILLWNTLIFVIPSRLMLQLQETEYSTVIHIEILWVLDHNYPIKLNKLEFKCQFLLLSNSNSRETINSKNNSRINNNKISDNKEV